MRAVIAVATMALAATAGAQQARPTAPPAGEAAQAGFGASAEVVLVSFEVVVTEKNVPVTGLSREDFVVFHDGKRVELTNFGAYARERTPATGEKPTGLREVPAQAPPPGRVCLYVDNESIAPLNRTRAVEAMAAFARARIAAGDLVMVATNQGVPTIVQPFTSDAYAVEDALARLRDWAGARATSNLERQSLEQEMDRVLNAATGRFERVAVAEASGVLDPSAAAGQTGRMTNMVTATLQQVREYADAERSRTITAGRALQVMLARLGGIPGRKSLVYVSDGLPEYPGLEVLTAFEKRFVAPGTDNFTRSPSAMFEVKEYEVRDLYDQIARTAAAGGITIHTIDARGLSGRGSQADAGGVEASANLDVSNYQTPLREMARATGGVAVVDTSDLSAGMGGITDALETYYLLGYPLPAGKGGRAHSVEVKLADTAANYRLDYRRTFVERTFAAVVEDRVIGGLFFSPDENLLEITASAGEPKPASGGRWEVPVKIGVPIGKLALLPDGDSMTGTVVAYYADRDAKGGQSDLDQAEHRIVVPMADYETAKNARWPITAPLMLKPGTHRISVGLREAATGLAGYATIDVEVGPKAADK